ncbi:MAG TPA: ABC transporter substrate-binding protein [Pseudorhodoplanes sp.]|nr:ABC transporter substrate-binding protein [Pseudorhodoplanes sp.]HVZ13769.1 ABC transporter substrate-binding protein [Bauldia sp.]
MKWNIPIAIAGVAMAGALLAAAPGIADDSAPAAKDKLIWSIPLPMTGPLAYNGNLFYTGWKDAIDYLNKNGGIRGHQIDARIYDDQYDVNVAVAGFKKAVADGGVVFASVDGTAAVRAISPVNNDQYKILTANIGNTSDQTDQTKYPYNLLVMPTYDDMFQMVLKYIQEKKPGASIALVTSDSEFGNDPLPHGLQTAKQLGLNVVLQETTGMTGVDVTPTAIKLRNANADYVIVHGYAANVWPEVLKLAREYGVKSQFIVTIVAGDPDLIKNIGPAADGVLAVEPFNLIHAGSKYPLMQTMETYLKNWTSKPTPYIGYSTLAYSTPWAIAQMLNQVMGKAIDDGTPLTGDNLIKIAKSMPEIDMGGLYGDRKVHFEDSRIPYGIIYRFHVTDTDFSMTPETDFMQVGDQ